MIGKSSRLSHIFIVCLLFVGSMFPTQSLLAAPVFTWLEPWGVDFAFDSAGDANRTEANFGIASTTNQAKSNLGTDGETGASSAFARAIGSVDVDFLVTSIASANVNFWRTFELAGSANGWDVSLAGFINGILQADLAFDGSAFVSATGTIVSGDIDAFVFAPATGILVSATSGVNAQGPFNRTTGKTSGALPDGIYSVKGSLQTKATIEDHFISNGVSESNFYDNNFGWMLTADAIPRAIPIPVPPPPIQNIPEPSSIFLFAIALVALVSVVRVMRTASPKPL